MYLNKVEKFKYGNDGNLQSFSWNIFFSNCFKLETKFLFSRVSHVNCFLLQSVSPSIRDEPKVLPKVANGLDALLKLKDNPLVAKRKAQKDICDNKSVILTSATKSDSKFDLDKIDEYKTLEDEPEIGQILAFKCMQLSPDYTPQMIQYVGELKIKEGDEVKFLLLHDDSEGTRRSDKFEIGDFVQGTTKRNTVVEFSWRMINDIRLIE